MTILQRRLIAALIALLAICLALAWTLFGGEALYRYALVHLAQHVPLSHAGGPRPDAWDQAAQPYYLISMAALIIAAGGSAALLVLVPNTGFRRRALIYCLFLAVVLPATWYNFGQKDVVLRPGLQAGLNISLIFLSTTIALWLSKAPAAELDVRVLKGIVLACLLLGGVFVPGLFTVVWLLVAAGALTVEQSQQVTFEHITGLASVVSAVLAVLGYVRDRRKTEAQKPDIVIARS